MGRGHPLTPASGGRRGNEIPRRGDAAAYRRPLTQGDDPVQRSAIRACIGTESPKMPANGEGGIRTLVGGNSPETVFETVIFWLYKAKYQRFAPDSRQSW